MKILSVETSCDETSCAIVEDGNKIIGSTRYFGQPVRPVMP